MGIFDFVKEAGEAIGVIKDKEKEAREEAAEELSIANKLSQVVVRLGLDIKNLRIDFDDGVATIHGTTETNAEREKVILAVGNSSGVAKVDDRIQVVAPEPEATMYTVVKGDTLSKISKVHYGDAMQYSKIFEANKPMLTDPDLIYPGQVLRIPPA